MLLMQVVGTLPSKQAVEPMSLLFQPSLEKRMPLKT